MKKTIILIAILFFTLPVFSQFSVNKMVGKHADNAKLGYGVFVYYDFPLNEIGNRSLRIELMDLVFFPPKNTDLIANTGYLTVKLGYKYLFSESKTGFYLEPQAGYGRATIYQDNGSTQKHYGDGFALALEAGYSLEVGQQDNTINIGLKYESVLAGVDYSVSALGLRVSYSFHLFRRKNDD